MATPTKPTKLTDADKATLDSLRTIFQSPESEAQVSMSNVHFECVTRCCGPLKSIESEDETVHNKIVKAGDVAKLLSPPAAPAPAPAATKPK